MLFKDAHAGIPAYIFDRNTLALSQGKVVSFTPSHLDIKMPSGKMVVDLVVNVNDNSQTYTIEDALDIAYFGTKAISIDRNAILIEIETVKANSEQVLNSIDYHHDVVDKCTQLLLDNNPSLKEKKETEERFTSIEGKLDELMAVMNKLMA